MDRALGMSDGILGALWAVCLFAICAVFLRFGVEYGVNSVRDVSRWVEYESVSPASESFPVGTNPVFYTRAVWHREVVASWPDVMWCEMTEGPDAGQIRRLSPNDGTLRYIGKPRLVGYYDDSGNTVDGGSSGYWEWNGPVPDHPAKCWLEPRPTIYPSLLVERIVPVEPTAIFYFK